ncbi:NUDIX domain-containing protein [Streptomyces sp. H39-S7]|uniref:NUDIX domain-containing protein n=1 Tax=Streptomyces sp. H39-S7 TaxID=3004357 RepID=UPI0022B04C4F|nr:NUDIX domain-containing protein [Streptomyces sp. H39-S7]MCZ4123011.1 NUDIX domain-containing protein [Streptomyces sp. H39-S7]
MPRREKDSNCSYCGTAFAPAADWPRTCAACGSTAYRNPLPVAIALLPVRDGTGTGLAVIRRTIEPGRGLLALPGGFIDHGETWEQAVVRELAEETGIAAAAADPVLADTLTDPEGGFLLVFGLLPLREAAGLPASVPTDETEGWEVLRAPAELAFPLHTLAVHRWFDGEYDGRATRP